MVETERWTERRRSRGIEDTETKIHGVELRRCRDRETEKGERVRERESEGGREEKREGGRGGREVLRY